MTNTELYPTTAIPSNSQYLIGCYDRAVNKWNADAIHYCCFKFRANNQLNIPFSLRYSDIIDTAIERNKLYYYILEPRQGQLPEKVTVSNIITFLRRLAYHTGNVLYKITITDQILYIGNGVILDENFNTIFLLARCLPEDYQISTNADFNKVHMYINPYIFSRKNALYKYIIDKLLHSKWKNYTYTENYYGGDTPIQEWNIVFSEFPYFTKLEVPVASSEEYSQYLLDTLHLL